MPAKTLTLVEYPSLQACKSVWKHPKVSDEDRCRVKTYCDRAIENGGSVSVDYNTKYECGRYYVTDASMHSACPMPGVVRATLFSDTEHDVDIVNCHPNILMDIMEKHYPGGALYPHLTRYVENRDEILASFQMKDKGVAKALFPIIMYGGSVRTWEKEFELTPKDYTLPPFVVEFEAEIKMLTTIILNNPAFKSVWQSFWRYKRDIAKEEHERKHMKKGKLPKNAPVFDVDDFDIHEGKKLSAVLQDHERLILEEAMKFAQERGVCVTSYCYDGFQALKQDFPPAFIDDLNAHIQSTDLGCRIEFIIKPFKTPLDLGDIKESERFDMREFEMIDEYSAKKAYFEKFHFKCIEPPCYVRVNKHSQQLLTLNAFPKVYNNLTIPSPPGCIFPRTSFTGRWMEDPEMRTYDNMDVLPPPLSCPEYTFNSWVDFPITEVPLDPTADTSRIYKHLDYTSNHNPLVKEYLLNWFAQMVQFPAHKSLVAILLQGEQGAGKSVVGEKLMEKILGLDKMMITSRLDHVLGKFSDSRGRILTVMNEMSGKDSFASEQLLLDHITAERVMCENKGIQSFQTKVYDRLIASTNSLNSVKIEKGDRRWMAVSVDNSIKNNKEYFDPLYKDLADEVVMRKFFEDLMTRDLSQWNPIKDRPVTELSEDMKELNADPLDLFEDYLRKNQLANEEQTGAELYAMFKEWWKQEGRNSDHLMTRTKFGTVFKRRPNVMCKKGSSCMWYSLASIQNEA